MFMNADESGRVKIAETPRDPLVGAFELLGKKWNGLILAALMSGPRRFAGLRDSVHGISESMLSERLNGLCSTELVSRTVTTDPPLSVTYALTARGYALAPTLRALSAWATKNLN